MDPPILSQEGNRRDKRNVYIHAQDVVLFSRAKLDAVSCVYRVAIDGLFYDTFPGLIPFYTPPRVHPFRLTNHAVFNEQG